MRYWICLLAAIVFEVFGTASMKLSEGMTRLVPSVLVFVLYALSFVALAAALKQIQVSVAYAIWSALGVVGITVIGVLYFHEPINGAKIFFTLVIIIGVAGLQLFGSSPR